MGLNIVFGRAGTGKSTYCLDMIKKMEEEGTDSALLYVVPEQYSLQAEKSLIAHLGKGGIMKSEVLSFERMAHRVISETGGGVKKYINKPGKRILLSHVIKGLYDELVFFKAASLKDGFVDTISKLISEFKKWGVNPAQLFEASKNETSLQLSKKLYELALIYNRYTISTDENYLDVEDDLARLAAKISSSDFLKGAYIWFDSFSGFTGAELGVIRELLKISSGVYVTITSDSVNVNYAGQDVFFVTKHTIKTLSEIAASVGTQVTFDDINIPIPYKYKNAPALSFLEKNYFEYGSRIFEGDASKINIAITKNPYREVEYVASEIIRLCREEGCRYNQITVLCKDIACYGKLIKPIFEEYRIPCFIDKKNDINSNPLVILIISLFGILEDKFTYDKVFSFLKSGLTWLDDKTDILENYCLCWNIRGTSWKKEWTYGKSSMDEDELKEINGIRQSFITPINRFFGKIKGKITAYKFCRELFMFLEDSGIFKKFNQKLKNFEELGDSLSASMYSQVYIAFCDCLDQIVNIFGEEKYSALFFKTCLEAGLTNYQVGVIPPGEDQVQVGDTERSKSGRVKALFIIGVNDGVFPSAMENEGILDDFDRKKLASYGLKLAPDMEMKLYEEQFQVYSALAIPSDYLYLSYSVSDSKGKAIRPSTVIARIKKIFPDIEEKSYLSEDISQNEIYATNYQQGFDLLVNVIRQSESMDFSRVTCWSPLYGAIVANKRLKERLDKVLGFLEYRGNRERVEGLSVKDSNGKLVTSVSKIERYVSCPFSYFSEYILKAYERQIHTFSAPESGILIHKALERISSGMNPEDWKKLSLDESNKMSSYTVDRLLQENPDFLPEAAARSLYLAHRIKETVGWSLYALSKHVNAGEYVPYMFEVPFGFDEKTGAGYKITDDCVVEGIIDRVDRTFGVTEGDLIRVIDYKSGNKEFDFGELIAGISIQLPIYLDIARHMFQNEKKEILRPAGMYYFKVHNPTITNQSTVLSDEAVDSSEFLVNSIEKEKLKKMIMSGVVLDTQVSINSMEKELLGKSAIMKSLWIDTKNMEIAPEKTITTEKSMSLPEKEFTDIINYAGEVAEKNTKKLMDGCIDIKPYRRNNSKACTYCAYAGLCKIDLIDPATRYNYVEKLNKQQAIDKINAKKND